MCANNDVWAKVRQEGPQISGGKLMYPGSKRTNFRRALRTIVEKTIHLRYGSDHAEITIRNYARDDGSCILIRVDNVRLKVTIAAGECRFKSVCRRSMTYSDVR
jgi:hypothetical protein